MISTICAIFTFTITSFVSFRRTFSYHIHVSFSYMLKNAVHTNPNRTYMKTGLFIKPHMIANALTIKAASVITVHTSISTGCYIILSYLSDKIFFLFMYLPVTCQLLYLSPHISFKFLLPCRILFILCYTILLRNQLPIAWLSLICTRTEARRWEQV